MIDNSKTGKSPEKKDRIHDFANKPFKDLSDAL